MIIKIINSLSICVSVEDVDLLRKELSCEMEKLFDFDLATDDVGYNIYLIAEDLFTERKELLTKLREYL